MEKRVKQISMCVKEKLGNGREHHSSMDRISELPDEILASIVSLLSLWEAITTTILSKRWLHIWTFAPPGSRSLDFDASMARWNYGKNSEAKISKYAEWVNKILELSKNLTLDEFKVCFCSDANYGHVIDKWIDFAIEKRVQFFELDLSTYDTYYSKPPEKYSFSQACYAHIQSPLGVSNIKSLKSITLKFVNVRGEILEFLLCSCPLLERLYVKRSDHLVNLKVAGSSLQLKYLKVECCLNLKSMEISAPQLVTFIYVGKSFKLHIEDAPLLVDVCISDLFCVTLTHVYSALASYLSQLETLKLEFNNYYEANMQLPRCEFTHLRHLILSVSAYNRASLLQVSSIIEASPILHRFTFQFPRGNTFRMRKIRTAPKCPHQHLKIVELKGFVGRATDLELAMYLLENAVMLEKIIITTTTLGTRRKNRRLELANEAARRLETMVPRGAELIIL